jgi:hypothetical protein
MILVPVCMISERAMRKRKQPHFRLPSCTATISSLGLTFKSPPPLNVRLLACQLHRYILTYNIFSRITGLLHVVRPSRDTLTIKFSNVRWLPVFYLAARGFSSPDRASEG